MSDEHIGFDARPAGVSGGAQSTEAVSLAEQISYANARGDGRPRAAIDPSDPVTRLELHAKQVIEDAKLSEHARMMALPKLSELLFWIRSGAGRG